MMQMFETGQLGYLAGSIDGEGCVSIQKSKPRRNCGYPYGRFDLMLSIENTDLRLMEWLKRNFGGRIWTSRKRLKANHKFELHWRINSNKAAVLLEACLPFLVIKKEQARIAIAFQKTKHSELQRQANGQIMRLDSHIFEERQKYYDKMKVLNRKGRVAGGSVA